MTGLVEALVSRFEIKEHFSDIPNAEFYVRVDQATEVKAEDVKEACTEFNYTFRGMYRLEESWDEVKAEVLN